MLRMLSVASFSPWYHADTMLSLISALKVLTQNMFVITLMLGSSGKPALRSDVELDDEDSPSALFLLCCDESSSDASAVSKSRGWRYGCQCVQFNPNYFLISILLR